MPSMTASLPLPSLPAIKEGKIFHPVHNGEPLI